MSCCSKAVLTFALAFAQVPVVVSQDNVFLWSSTGGGWRSQGANMGYANLFTQAGLISEDSSLFSTISGTSGAAWFSTQLFYSNPFFQSTTTSTPDELYDFVLSWMDSYEAFSQNLTTNPECEFLDDGKNFTIFQVLREFCNIMVDFQGDWASFVSGMYRATSSDYGDLGLVDRLVNSENRVEALSVTDTYIQTSLLANSRIRQPSDDDDDDDIASYIGPKNDEMMLNSIPLAVDWAVTTDDVFYFSNEPDQCSVSSSTYAGETSKTFTFADWNAFPFYPGDNGTVSIPMLPDTRPVGSLQQPFFSGRIPTVGQIGAASSAAAGSFSGLVPSTLAQAMSVSRNGILTNSNSTTEEKAEELAGLTLAIDAVYKNDIVDNLAVCTQWPEECGENDAYFMDGFVTDGPTLALNIGLYQQMSDGDLSKTLKVFLTSNDNYWSLPLSVLAYFTTTFNRSVDPGSFIWPTLEGQSTALPLFSPQIFDSYLDLDILNCISEPIEGLNVTTAVLRTRTLDNPAFKVKAGQMVEIFLLNLNSNIPTFLIGATLIEEWKEPIADLARDISESKTLISRVESFMVGDDGIKKRKKKRRRGDKATSEEKVKRSEGSD